MTISKRLLCLSAVLLLLSTISLRSADAFLVGGVPTNGGTACPFTAPLDSLSSSAAYGLRLLRTAYATPSKIIKVQRTSDNSQSDIGLVNCSLDTTTLNTFCASTTCFVTTWYDQSGNNANVTQATFANMPQILTGQQNGHPALVFNGTSDELTGTLAASVQFGTFVAVGKTGSSFAASQYMANVANALTDNMGINSFTASPNCLAISQHSASQKGTIACSTSTWYRWVGTIGPSLASIYLNGTKGTDATSSSFQMIAGNQIFIGAAVTNIFFWGGSISEILFFSPDISSTNSNIVSSNQGSYWGL